VWVEYGDIVDYVREELQFPGVRQVALLRKTISTAGKTEVEDWFLITSASPEQLPPEKLLKISRQHWDIENGLHHVKDRTMGEDAHVIKMPQLAPIFATLRNLSLNIIRLLNPNPPPKLSIALQCIQFRAKPLQSLKAMMDM
jgi:hypothetical protein